VPTKTKRPVIKSYWFNLIPEGDDLIDLHLAKNNRSSSKPAAQRDISFCSQRQSVCREAPNIWVTSVLVKNSTPSIVRGMVVAVRNGLLRIITFLDTSVSDFPEESLTSQSELESGNQRRRGRKRLAITLPEVK
jgi:hypothetical protein